MTPIKVGILEDDPIIGMSIVNDLESLGYLTTEIATDPEMALQMITEESPDIIIVDIMLGDGMDGIAFAKSIKFLNIPVIFATAYSDVATVKRAKEAEPAAYLVKPFNKNDLYAAIEVAMANYCARVKPGNKQVDLMKGTEDEIQYRINDAIFVKQGQYIRKVRYDDILFIESINTCLYIQTIDRRVVVRAGLSEYLQYLNSKKFCRVHRAFAVNMQKIDAIQTEHLLINNYEIPVGKMYRAQLMDSIKIF